MFPGMNQKALKQAMKKMGMTQEDIDASQVIIKCEDKEIIISNPQVTKINMMGQETFQISGNISEKSLEKISEEDINTVAEQANVSKEKALKTLEKNNGDLAKSILELKKFNN